MEAITNIVIIGSECDRVSSVIPLYVLGVLYTLFEFVFRYSKIGVPVPTGVFNYCDCQYKYLSF